MLGYFSHFVWWSFAHKYLATVTTNRLFTEYLSIRDILPAGLEAGEGLEEAREPVDWRAVALVVRSGRFVGSESETWTAAVHRFAAVLIDHHLRATGNVCTQRKILYTISD